jgi:hypothetical protein
MAAMNVNGASTPITTHSLVTGFTKFGFCHFSKSSNEGRVVPSGVKYPILVVLCSLRFLAASVPSNHQETMSIRTCLDLELVDRLVRKISVMVTTSSDVVRNLVVMLKCWDGKEAVQAGVD